MTSKYAQKSSRGWFWVFKISGKARVLKQSQPALLCSVSRMTILPVFTRVTNVRDQTCQTFVACSGKIGDSTCKFLHGPHNVWSTNACQLQAFEDNLRANFWQLSNWSHFFFLKLMVVKACSCDFVQLLSCSVRQFAKSFHACLCMTFHIIGPWGHVRVKFLRTKWSRNDVGSSKINVFHKYFPHWVNVLFLSSQFDVVHIHWQE